MQVFLDNFIVYSCTEEHLDHLWMCLEKCRRSQLSLNLAKCVFMVTSGALLGHIVSKDRLVVDPGKAKEILQALAPTTAKALSWFVGQTRWHGQILRYLVDFATQLHVVVHHVPFKWTEQEEKAY